MKILLIYRIDTADLQNLGVIHKMHGQAKAFNDHGKVDILTLKGNHLLFNSKKIHSFISVPLAKLWFYKKLQKIVDIHGYDLVYIRYTLSDKSFIHLLKHIRAKIVLEIPTYPYESEYKGWINRWRIKADRNWRGNLKNFVDRMVHYGPHQEVYDIPTIRMTNGFDVDSCAPSSVPFNRSKINMIAVGKWNQWHGLDRLIHAMATYYHTKMDDIFPVFFNVIGDGPELKSYQELVDRLELKDYVIFHGIKEGKELDEIFREADVGVGSLGLHRIGLSEASPLKHREYAVRGLIILQGGEDAEIDEAQSILIPKSSVQLQDVIDQYIEKSSKGNKNDFSALSKKKYGWKVRIETILSAVELTEVS